MSLYVCAKTLNELKLTTNCDIKSKIHLKKHDNRTQIKDRSNSGNSFWRQISLLKSESIKTPGKKTFSRRDWLLSLPRQGLVFMSAFDATSNSNLEVCFCGGRKIEETGEKHLKHGTESTRNSAHIYHDRNSYNNEELRDDW